MKRKAQAKSDPVIHPEILEQAKRAVSSDRIKKVAKCVVCGGDAPAEAPEPLCWVCRRLKVSAWRENDQQMPAQE